MTYWNAPCMHKHTHTQASYTKFTLCSSISELVPDPFQYQTLHLYNKPVTHYVHKHLRITTNCTRMRGKKKCGNSSQARPSGVHFFPVSFHRHHMIGKSKCRTNSTIIMISVCWATTSVTATAAERRQATTTTQYQRKLPNTKINICHIKYTESSLQNNCCE